MSVEHVDLRDLARELQGFMSMLPDDCELYRLVEWENGAHQASVEEAGGDWERFGALLRLESQLGDLDEYARNESDMIADRDFEEYAQELAEEYYMIPPKVQWPFTCIDWKEAADELKQEYTEVDFDGDTYQIRS